MQILRSWINFGELYEIERRAANKYREVGYDPTYWTNNFPEDFARYAANDLIWVAVDSKVPIGFAIADIFGDALHLEEIDVLPEYQGKGIGRRLVECVIAEANRRLMRRVTLRTFRNTPWSTGLYESCGFKQLEIPFAYLESHVENEKQMGLEMQNRITFELPIERTM